MDQDQVDVVIMPFTTVQKKVMGIYWVDDIFCSAVSAAAMKAAEADITALLRERHRILASEADDFNLRHPVEIARARAAAQRTMTWLLGSIASVALLVGGIGIMNIMLVSVAERTREIGIRMAVGAKERDIRAQFLVEAVTLSLIGGGIGVGLGLLVAYGIAAVVQWQTLVGADAIAAALACAGGIGTFFGFYPAHRASRLHPIEALRR